MVGGEPKGLVLPPHVFVDATNDWRSPRTSSSAPWCRSSRCAGDEEALEVANATPYGLSGRVFTRDVERGLRFAQSLQVGMSHVNDPPVLDLANSPFGGEKNSGLGRYNGAWAIEEFTTPHWITVQHVPIRYPF